MGIRFFNKVITPSFCLNVITGAVMVEPYGYLGKAIRGGRRDTMAKQFVWSEPVVRRAILKSSKWM